MVEGKASRTAATQQMPFGVPQPFRRFFGPDSQFQSRTKAIIETLKSGKSVVRGQLAVAIDALTPALKQVYHAKSGVFVNEVQPDGPAAGARIRGEDVITRYKGELVTSPDHRVHLVRATEPGSSASVELPRDGKPIALKVVVGTLSGEATPKPTVVAEEKKVGLTVEDVCPPHAEQIGTAGSVQVTAVEPLGDAAHAGILGGDVIVSINTQPVRSVEAYNRVVGKLTGGDPVVLRVWRSHHILAAEIDRLSG